MKKLISILILLVMIPIVYSENYVTEEIILEEDGTAYIKGKTNLDFLTLIDLKDEIIDGYTAELTRKEGINWFFEYQTEEETDYIIKLILPGDTKISNVATKGKTSIEVENGKHVLMFTGKNETMDIKVQYSFKEKTEEKDLWFYTTIGLTIIVILLLRKPKEKKVKKQKEKLKIDEEKIKTIRLTLNEAQLKILDTLQEKGGEASQTTIRYMANLPKSSLSRNLELMAQKNIITKFYNGTSNYVKIHPSLLEQEKN